MKDDQPKDPEGVTGAENTSGNTQGEVLGLEKTLISVLYLITRKKKIFTFVKEFHSLSLSLIQSLNLNLLNDSLPISSSQKSLYLCC